MNAEIQLIRLAIGFDQRNVHHSDCSENDQGVDKHAQPSLHDSAN